jgi:hypothetical protein
VRGWIGQRVDDLELLDDRSRPTVRDDQRERILVARTNMDEVNVDAVDGRHELRQCIQPRFHLAPVVAAAPVPNQLLQLGQLHALRLIGNGFFIGPSRGGEPPAEIDQCLVRNVDLERPNCTVVGRGMLTGKKADSNRGSRRGQNVSAAWQRCRHDILVRFLVPRVDRGQSNSPTIRAKSISASRVWKPRLNAAWKRL